MSESDKMPSKLSASVIETEIESRVSVAVHTVVFDAVDSTNTWLVDNHSQFDATLNNLVICATEHQTAGRGRRGKTWHTPTTGVTFSMCLHLPHSLAEVSGVSLLSGAAICDCLRDYLSVNAMLKWPNDIFVGNAKLAGILVEVASHSSASTTLVIGIGVNYRRGCEQANIDQRSIDLAELCDNNPPDRSILIGQLAASVYRACMGSVVENLARLADRWSDYDALTDADIELLGGNGKRVNGRAGGIDHDGRLQVLCGGQLMSVSSGDVSVRPKR